MSSDQKNPLYPIEINEYPKLFDYVLSKQGLIYFQTLKRNYILGKDMSLDEYNKLRLMHVYYATANRNPHYESGLYRKYVEYVKETMNFK